MEPLHVHLLGALAVFRDGRLLRGFPTQKSRGLFAYLALHHGRLHSRRVLVGHFWGDSPEAVARKNLRTDLWRIRSVLEEGAAPGWCVCGGRDQVGFNVHEHWLDVHEFEDRLDRAAGGPGQPPTGAQAALLHQAVELYRGDLLEGVYDDWCVFERERLRLRYLDALERLGTYHDARGEWALAAACAQRLLAHDPLREHVHRELMRCHLALGDPAAALRQFDACARLLRRELDVEPAQETRALLGGVFGGGPGPSPRTPAAAQAPAPPASVALALDEVLARLRSAAQWLEETGEQVQIVIRDVEKAHALSRGLASTRSSGS